MTQTIGTGGGAATRQFSNNLYKIIRKQDLESGVVYVADHIKVDAELNQIFNSVGFADPTVTGSNQNGNMGGAMVQFTTPKTLNTEFVVAHKMGRIPVGFIVVGPQIVNAGNVILRVSRAADVNNWYFQIVNSSDENIVTAVITW
jgi:hypothetical protein